MSHARLGVSSSCRSILYLQEHFDFSDDSSSTYCKKILKDAGNGEINNNSVLLLFCKRSFWMIQHAQNILLICFRRFGKGDYMCHSKEHKSCKIYDKWSMTWTHFLSRHCQVWQKEFKTILLNKFRFLRLSNLFAYGCMVQGNVHLEGKSNCCVTQYLSFQNSQYRTISYCSWLLLT